MFFKKSIVKKLLNIEIVIFHTFSISEAYSKKYRLQEVVPNKFEKGPLRDCETALCSFLALIVLEKKQYGGI
jgi:hypothetical protein